MTKKIIEVAPLLEVSSAEAAWEKLICHGYPATLYLWWVCRPLVACRVLLFTSFLYLAMPFLLLMKAAKL